MRQNGKCRDGASEWRAREGICIAIGSFAFRKASKADIVERITDILPVCWLASLLVVVHHGTMPLTSCGDSQIVSVRPVTAVNDKTYDECEVAPMSLFWSYLVHHHVVGEQIYIFFILDCEVDLQLIAVYRATDI